MSARWAAARRTPRASSASRSAGFDDAQTARIHGPVGLAIGARSPAEIAVAIVAQVTRQLRRPDPAAVVAGAGA